MEPKKIVKILEDGVVADDLAVTPKERMVLQKFRQARRLAEEGHRSRLEIMFYDDGKSCDITIEDRERVVERMVDKDM